MGLFQQAVLNKYLGDTQNVWNDKPFLSQDAEWMEYFNDQKAKAYEIKSQFAQTDREIDAMVYELYGLSEGIN